MQILLILLFVFYILWTGFLWSKVLNSVFGLREKYINIPLGIFASFLFLSFVASVFVVWYKITWPVISFVYIVGVVLPFVLCKKIKSVDETESLPEEVFGIFPKRKFLLLCFALLSILQIAILVLCQTDKVLTTPWQTLHPWYLYNFFLLTFLLGVLLFSRISFRLKFLLVVAYSLLLHLYLPLAHVMPWGGDVWRMIGVEQKLALGEAQLPVLPSALWNPYKYTYGQLWGLMVLLNKSLDISLIALHRWFMPIIWGLILPVLAFSLGNTIFSNKKKALTLSAVISFPFALQAIGSITVSMSFGFLTFLFGLLLLFIFLKEKQEWQKRIVFAYALCMLFGYALYAILFYFVIALSLLLLKTKNKKTILVIVASVFLFPAIDFLLGFSHFPSNFSIVNFFKQVLGQFGGWYFARPISNIEISSANILFNHLPQMAYVKNIFSAFRWPVVLLCILSSISLVSAFYCVIKKETNRFVQMLAILSVSTFGGYSIGWYILTGDRVFVRRLDSILAFLLVFFVLYGIFAFDFSKIISKLSSKKTYIYFLTLLTFFSFCATTIYATGPDIRVLSSDEYQAASFLWSQEKENQKSCVLADTWPLLALEGVSGGRVVGGGFPIDANFGQAERVRLYSELLKNPDIRIIPQIQALVDVSFCYIVVSRDQVDPRIELALNHFLGDLLFKSGPILVWKLELKKL